MRLRVFRAATMAAAMTAVRREFGAEALILSTRRVAGGVELTAAIEPEPLGSAEEAAAQSPAAPLPCPMPPADRRASLGWHGIPPAMARRLEAGPLAFALSAALRFAALPLQPGAEPLLLVGPPGAGKTLTVARLATRLVLAGIKPVVITADTARAGAAERLAAFTHLLGLELLAVSQPDGLARALARRTDGAPVLIDTQGADLFDPAEQSALAALTQAAQGTMVAVMPAGLDAQEAGEMAASQFGQGIRLLVTTRLDLTRRLGSVLAAADAGLMLAEFGVSPGAADGLVPATPALLARRLEAAPPPAAHVSAAQVLADRALETHA